MFQYAWIARRIELDLDTDALATLTVRTELPVRDLTIKASATFNTEATTTGRRTWRITLPGEFKFHLIQFKVSCAGVARLFAGRIFAKPLGLDAGWQWYALPIPQTSEAFREAALPIPGTDEAFREAPLPIPGTSEAFQEAVLPIPGTGEAFQEAALPIPGTGEAYSEAAIPIPGTSEAFRELGLPLPEERPETWIELPSEDE